jgi:hypothetical protein
MNLACAYCGFPFAKVQVASRHEDAAHEPLTCAVLALALAVPVVGLVAGCRYLRRPEPAQRAAGRLWLIASVCSSLAYLLVFTRYLGL